MEGWISPGGRMARKVGKRMMIHMIRTENEMGLSLTYYIQIYII